MKEINNEIYMHKSQADRIKPGSIIRRGADFVEKYNEAKEIFSKSGYKSIDYNCIVWKYKKNEFRFDVSSDFDTNSEPGIDLFVNVNLNNGNIGAETTSGVWHGKEMWVDDDYTGFDIEKAKKWRNRYKSELEKHSYVDNKGKTRIPNPSGGSRGSWMSHLMDLGIIDEYFAENGIEDPVGYFKSLSAFGKYPGGKLLDRYLKMKNMKNENIIRRVVRNVLLEALDVNQEFTSKNTDNNWKRGNIASGFRHFGSAGKFAKGNTNLDIGGGRSDLAHEFLNSEFGAINLVFDPFNRSSDYNASTIAKIEELGGADTVTCFNCLNVIKEPEVRDNVILQCAQALKPGGEAFFQVYSVKNETGPRATKNGSWQEFRDIDTYVEEINRHFGNVSIVKGKDGKKYIIASEPMDSDIQSQWRLDADGNEWRTLNFMRENDISRIVKGVIREVANKKRREKQTCPQRREMKKYGLGNEYDRQACIQAFKDMWETGFKKRFDEPSSIRDHQQNHMDRKDKPNDRFM